MKKKVSFILFMWILGGLASCNMPVPVNPGTVDHEVVQHYSTVSVLLTETAQAVSVSTPVPGGLNTTATVVNPAATISPSTEEVAALASTTEPTRTKEPASGKAQAAPCDLAQPGRPIDISVPDDTHFHPGEYFSKTWRLVNAGSCPWTNKYALIWFSGDDLGVNHVQPLNMEVRQGHVVDVTVDMTAPQEPGSYQSNWKLRNQQGQLFGIGPGGDAPFWVRIVVIPVDTLTPTPSLEAPTITPTAVVFASGSLALKLGDEVDLDSGQLNQAEGNDLALQHPEDEQVLLAPLNGARLAPFGVTVPTLEDCLKSGFSDVAVPLDQYPPGSYLCFRTTRSLPGWLSITAVDPKTGKLSLDFVTWAVP